MLMMKRAMLLNHRIASIAIGVVVAKDMNTDPHIVVRDGEVAVGAKTATEIGINTEIDVTKGVRRPRQDSKG